MAIARGTNRQRVEKKKRKEYERFGIWLLFCALCGCGVVFAQTDDKKKYVAHGLRDSLQALRYKGHPLSHPPHKHILSNVPLQPFQRTNY